MRKGQITCTCRDGGVRVTFGPSPSQGPSVGSVRAQIQRRDFWVAGLSHDITQKRVKVRKWKKGGLVP